MSEHTVSLAEVYRGWDNFQARLRTVVAPLTPAQLALPVAPKHWPIGRVVQHILADRIWWFHLWLGQGGPEITAHMRWEDDQPLLPADALVAGLDASWEMIAGALTHWTVADHSAIVPQPPELTDEERKTFGPAPRQEIIFHVMRHDFHHGGELAVGMGGYGLPTIWG